LKCKDHRNGLHSPRQGAVVQGAGNAYLINKNRTRTRFTGLVYLPLTAWHACIALAGQW